jgi:hypothetical protein
MTSPVLDRFVAASQALASTPGRWTPVNDHGSVTGFVSIPDHS